MASLTVYPQTTVGLITPPANWGAASPKPLMTGLANQTVYTNTYGGGATSGRWNGLHNNSATVSASNTIGLPTTAPSSNSNVQDTGTFGWWLDPSSDSGLPPWPYKVLAGTINISMAVALSSASSWTAGQLGGRIFLWDDNTSTWSLINTFSNSGTVNAGANTLTAAACSTSLASDLTVTNRQYLYVDFWATATVTLAPGGSSKLQTGSNTFITFVNGFTFAGTVNARPQPFLGRNQAVDRASFV